MTRDLELPLPDLGLSAAEADERFARLQARLISLWKSIQAFNVPHLSPVRVAMKRTQARSRTAVRSGRAFGDPRA
jgi:hypothetical protein